MCLCIDNKSGAPIYDQICTQLRRLILEGELQEVREEIGVVLEDAGLPGAMNARQIGKDIMASVYRNWEAETYDRYLKGLTIPMEKPYRDFSRGMKMKLAISIALSKVAPGDIIGRKDGRFGIEAIVRRDAVREGMRRSRITIEALFVFMVKAVAKRKVFCIRICFP